MINKRKVELFDNVLSCLLEHLNRCDIKTALKKCCGFTEKEYNELGIVDYELTDNEKRLIQYLNDDNTRGNADCELGFDYFMDLCNDFDIIPHKEFVDELENNGIYIEGVNKRQELGG